MCNIYIHAQLLFSDSLHYMLTNRTAVLTSCVFKVGGCMSFLSTQCAPATYDFFYLG